MSKNITVATKANFEELLASEKPVIVDFWATWCGPCKMLAPIVEELADENADKITFVKCDVDECDNIARSYGIMSIPTLVFFKNGEEVKREIGLRQKAALQKIIEDIL